MWWCFVSCGCCWSLLNLIVGVYRRLLLCVVADDCSPCVLHVVVVVCSCVLLVDCCRCCSLFAVVVATVAVVCDYLLVLFVVVGAC